jgi:hypothetical protein
MIIIIVVSTRTVMHSLLYDIYCVIVSHKHNDYNNNIVTIYNSGL